MKRKLIKFFSLTLAIMMLVSVLPVVPAMGATDEQNDNRNFYKDDHGVWHIVNVEGFKAFADTINNDKNSYSGKTVVLDADIDLQGTADNPWVPMNGFSGTFDGGSHTISNLYVHSTEESGVGFGLFGNANGSVKNLTIHNAHVKGNSACGAFVGKGNGLLENLKLTGLISIGTTTNQGHLANFNSSYIGGIRGNSFRGKIKNCTVDGDSGSVIGGGRQVGGILGFDSYGFPDSVVNCTVKNVTVLGGKSIGGVVGWANSTGIQNCSIENVRVELTNAAEPKTIGLISGTSRCLMNDTETTIYENNTVDADSVLVVNGETPSFDSDPVLRLYSPYSSASYITLADGKYMFTCYGIEKAMTKGDNITLLALRSDPVTIPADRTITIDLNGNTIAGDFGVPAVINNGTLTIKNGTVVGDIVGDNVTEENITKQEPTCVAKIGDSRYSDLSKALNAAQDGEVVTLTQNIEEKNRIEIATGKKITFDLAGYTLTSYSGDAILIYKRTELTIKDSVGGGTIDHRGSDDICWSQATFAIESGNFKTTGEYGIAYNSDGATTSISGGYFTNDPTAYLTSGKAIVPSDKAGYDFKVGDAAAIGEGDTEVYPAPDSTPDVDTENMTTSAASAEEATAQKQAVKTAIENATSNGLTLEAAAVAQDPQKVTEANVADGLEAVQKEAFGEGVTDASGIKLVVQPYLDIEAKSYTATETEKTLNVDITPKYNLLATKKDTDVTELNTTGTGDEKNAVVVESGNELPVDQNTRVTIHFQLPAGFVNDTSKDNLYVVHTKKDGSTETYKADVSKSDDVYIASFTTNGFSPFVFTVDARTASVQFQDKDGNPIGKSVVYLPSSVGNELPVLDAPGGQVFGGWRFEGIAKTYKVLTDELLSALATSGSETITATPVFYTRSMSSDSYAITVESGKHGIVTANRSTASKGATITLTVDPDKGYTLETLTVTDGSGKVVALTEKNGKYTFTMPASKVTVKAAFAAVVAGSENPFVDVADDAYYADAVLWAAKNGITGGTSATTFSPDAICTRAQAVTFLWRAAGSPAPKSSDMPFEDVAAGSYYHDAVLWAVENGITKGTSATAFSPNADCTRAQIVTFLWRSQASPAAGTVNPFTDVAADAYYNSAVLWAVENGITTGTTAATFSPNNDCTRAQIVTFLYRCMK